jgi:hypothetical protein
MEIDILDTFHRFWFIWPFINHLVLFFIIHVTKGNKQKGKCVDGINILTMQYISLCLEMNVVTYSAGAN